MPNTKDIIRAIYNNDAVKVSEDVSKILAVKQKQLLEQKTLEITAKVFDTNEYSTRNLKETVVSNRTKARHQVLLSLREAVDNN